MSFRNALIAAALNKPYKRRLNYLRATGAQYINTGIAPDVNTRMEIAFPQFVDVGYINWMCGSRSGSNIDNFGIYGQYLSGSPVLIAGYSSNVQWNIPYQMGKSVELGTQLYVDHTLVHTFSAPSFTLNAKFIYLFARNDQGTPQFGQCAIAYCRIWQGNVLVRDLIPVLEYDNTASMYDQITQNFFRNQGAGTFLYE